MEALSNYFITLPAFQSRIFVSNPPGAALLIWTNQEFLPNISGISVVEQEGNSSGMGLTTVELLEVLRNQLYGTIPVLHIIYKADMTSMLIDDIPYDLGAAANVIAKRFHISLGSQAAKAPNNAAQISDPFHIWSRGAFDGRTVMKTDVDFLLTRDKKVSSIWEIKRSSVIKVGAWAPYVNPAIGNDINNYYMLISFSNILKCKMLTIHHEEMSSETIFNGTERVDFFVYNPKPDIDTLNSFAARRTATTNTINQMMGI